MVDFILYLFIVPVIAALGGAVVVFFIWIGYLMLEDMREVRASRAHASQPSASRRKGGSGDPTKGGTNAN